MFSIAFTHLNACLDKCQVRSVSRVWRTVPRVHLDVDGKWRFLVWGMVLNGEGVRKTNIESLDAELFFKRPPWKSSPWDPKIKSEIHLQFGFFSPAGYCWVSESWAWHQQEGQVCSLATPGDGIGNPGPVGPPSTRSHQRETRPLKGRTIIAWTQWTHESFVSEIRKTIFLCHVNSLHLCVWHELCSVTLHVIICHQTSSHLGRT